MVIDISKQNNNSSGGGRSGKFLFPCKVKRIILNGSESTNSPTSADKWGGYDAVGRIFYNRVRVKTQGGNKNIDYYDKEEVDTWEGSAIPLFSFQKYYPLINEVVMVMTITSKDYLTDRTAVQDYYMPSLNLWNSQHHNTLPALQNYSEDTSELRTNKDYELAGLLRRVEDGELDINIPLGKYFKEQLNIKPLLPYEGDHIIEGRFGNSIRFGATARSKDIPKEQKNNWSNGAKGDPHGDPVTIIRNGQAEGLDSKGWIHTLEDINLDPSSIYLTSNQKIDNLVIASTHWNTFGLNAAIPQDEQREAKKFLDSPVDFMTGDEVPIESEEEKTTQEKPQCPEGQVWDEAIQKCVLATVEVNESTSGSLETETSGSETITEEEAGLVEEEKTTRYYQKENDIEELEEIPSALPANYRQVVKSSDPMVFGYNHCGGCDFYNNGNCSKWGGAKVRGRDTDNQWKNWVCDSFATPPSYNYASEFPKTFRLSNPKSLNESKIKGKLQVITHGPDKKIVGTLYVPDPYTPSSIEAESYKSWTLDETEVQNMIEGTFNLLEGQIRSVYEIDMDGRLELGDPLPFTEEPPSEPTSQTWTLLGGNFYHSQKGYYAAYSKRVGQGAKQGLYIYGADGTKEEQDASMEVSFPNTPNTNKQARYAGSLVSFEGFSATSLTTSEINTLLDQVKDQLNQYDWNDMGKNQWS